MELLSLNSLVRKLLALTLALSPEEREHGINALGKSRGTELFPRRNYFLPLRGERAGVRENNPSFIGQTRDWDKTSAVTSALIMSVDWLALIPTFSPRRRSTVARSLVPSCAWIHFHFSPFHRIHRLLSLFFAGLSELFLTIAENRRGQKKFWQNRRRARASPSPLGRGPG